MGGGWRLLLFIIMMSVLLSGADHLQAGKTAPAVVRLAASGGIAYVLWNDMNAGKKSADPQ